MNYLVTGAAGFIGGSIAKRLSDNGHAVTTIDNLSTGNVSNIPTGCKFIEGDVSDEKIIAKLEDEKYDAIIHMAGQSSGEISFENPVADLQTNTQSTIMLLDYARRNNIEKFIYASSMSVYGDTSSPCMEHQRLKPKSFYAIGKMASENYMRLYSQYGIACTVLRFFNVYGIGQNLNNLKQGMASIFLAMAIKDRHIVVKGAKDRYRDFVYIDDVVDSVLRALTNEEGFSVYNVCTGRAITVEHVINCIKENLSYDVTVEYIEGTPGDQYGVCGDNNKIRSALGWNATIEFEEGIKKMIVWARTKF